MQMTAGQGRSGWMGCTRMTQRPPAGHAGQDGAGGPGDVVDDEVVDVTDLVHAQELVIDDAVEELEAARAEEQSRQAQAARPCPPYPQAGEHEEPRHKDDQFRGM